MFAAFQLVHRLSVSNKFNSQTCNIIDLLRIINLVSRNVWFDVRCLQTVHGLAGGNEEDRDRETTKRESERYRERE